MRVLAIKQSSLLQAAMYSFKNNDLCLCEYTSHSHCGLVRGEKVLNSETPPGETVASHAAA